MMILWIRLEMRYRMIIRTILFKTALYLVAIAFDIWLGGGGVIVYNCIAYLGVTKFQDN